VGKTVIMAMEQLDLKMAVDGVPYFITATPFQLNGDMQFHVSINNV